MNRFNQKLFLENKIRQMFAKKASWELNCCKILPGSGIPDNSLTRLRNFSWKRRPKSGTSRMAQYGSAPSYSNGALTIENIKETYIRHFIRHFQLSKNVACDVYPSKKCTQLDLSKTKWPFLLFFSTGILFFQSFGVQMVHCIIQKTSWYIELIHLSDLLAHRSVSRVVSPDQQVQFPLPFVRLSQ